MTIQIEIAVGQMIATEEGEAEIVSIKGRWVKLDDDTNISRAAALEGREQYLLDNAEDDAEDTNEADAEDMDDEEDDSTMAGTLNKYRPGYVKTVNWSGSASVDNGDDVAELLRGLNPDETCAIADHMFGELPGTHFAKYQYLNRGQRRMNAGNRIRALIKRGEKTAADLQAAIRGDDLVDDETVV